MIRYQIFRIFAHLHVSIGVLLLNACLTVRERQPNSHAGKVSEVPPQQDAILKRHVLYSYIAVLPNACVQGWEKLTDAVIHWINDNLSGVVFLLWGSYAQKKGAFINEVS